jgi:isopenicillin-N N-acyltransferase-like protein
MATEYPLFEARGTPREVGRQHGAQAREQIRGYLAALAESLQIGTLSLRERAGRFQPMFASQVPDLWDEVRGLAEGAGITDADALALQLRGELGQLPDGACTTFAITPAGTATGTTLAGQTSDNPPELEHFGYVLRLYLQGKPALLMWTFGGMLGYHGLNEHGVCHFANALGGGPAWKFALSHYPLKRRILEQRSLDEVLALFERFPVCSNGNYMLADDTGQIADVELTSAGPVLVGRGDPPGFLVHANHYVCGAHACEANWRHSPADSFPRQARLQSLIAEGWGTLTVSDLRRFLADHEGAPVGICRHPHTGPSGPMLDHRGKTVAALIAEPQHRRLHVALGNPCENRFVCHSL